MTRVDEVTNCPVCGKQGTVSRHDREPYPCSQVLVPNFYCPEHVPPPTSSMQDSLSQLNQAIEIAKRDNI